AGRGSGLEPQHRVLQGKPRLAAESVSRQALASFPESQFAVRNSRASSPKAPTSCTPIGMPPSPFSNGSDTAGNPASVHNVLNAGLPVAMPFGATPGAAGVRIAS